MPDRGLPAARGGTAWRRRMINGGVGGLRASILMIHDAAVSRCDQKATAFIFRPCVAIDISALAPPFAASTASLATYCQVLAKQGLMGVTLPERDCGQDGSLMDAVIAIEQVAAICPRIEPPREILGRKIVVV